MVDICFYLHTSFFDRAKWSRGGEDVLGGDNNNYLTDSMKDCTDFVCGYLNNKNQETETHGVVFSWVQSTCLLVCLFCFAVFLAFSVALHPLTRGMGNNSYMAC